MIHILGKANIGLKNLHVVKISIIKRASIFLSMSVLTYVLLDYSLIFNKIDIKYSFVEIVVSIIIICVGGLHYRTHSSSFCVLLSCILLSICKQINSEYVFMNILSIVFIYVVYNLKREFYPCLAMGLCVGSVYYFLHWLNAMFMLGSYMGNRGPLNFSVIILMITPILSKEHKFLKYLLIFIMTLICFIGSSRSSLIICIFVLMINAYLEIKQRWTKNKVIVSMLIIGILVLTLLYNQERIIQLLFHKWGSSQNIFLSGRLLIWQDALSRITLWGYSQDYTMQIWGLQNAHNAFVQAYISFGILAGIMYIIWCVSILVKCYKLRKNTMALDYIIVYIAFLILSITESMFILDIAYPCIGICFAAIAGQINRIYSECINCTKERI